MAKAFHGRIDLAGEIIELGPGSAPTGCPIAFPLTVTKGWFQVGEFGTVNDRRGLAHVQFALQGAQAVSAAAEHYQIQQIENVIVTAAIPLVSGMTIETIVAKARLIGVGQALDSRENIVAHATILDDGSTKVILKFSANCR